MLIIPLEKSFNWKRPPVVTLLLIAINSCVLVFVQTDSDALFEQWVEHYLHSELPEIELPRYLEALEARGDREKVGQWRALRKHGFDDETRVFLLIEMESDDAFMRRLHAHQVISEDDDDFETWASARTRFEAIRKQSTTYRYGFIPSEHRLVTLLSYMFLHGGAGHLIGNMLFLFLIGFSVEVALGSLLYLGFYVAAGVGAVLLFWGVYPGSVVPLVGASGAIAGLMGLYAILFGFRRIRFFYWVLFYFDYVKAPAIILFPVWLANEAYQLLWGGISEVAYVAHIGGLLVGGALGVAIKRMPERIDTQYLDASERAEARLHGFKQAMRLLGSLEVDKTRVAFRALHREYPDDREVLLQLYKAEKFTPGSDAYHEVTRRVLALPGNEAGTIRHIHETFRDYLETTRGKVRLEHAHLVELAIRFARGGFPETANRIVSNLLKRTRKAPGLDRGLLSVAKAWQRAHNEQQYRHCLRALVHHFPQSDAAAAARQVLGERGA